MKVLIVEDEILERKALIHLMKTEFEQVSIVLTADNGEQAVKMAVQERPDLILMDINLPLLDGISAMKMAPFCSSSFNTNGRIEA